MAEVGFDETPMRPTIREATTTNARPKTATPSAERNRGPVAMSPARRPGTAKSTITTNTGVPRTIHAGRSRSVRGASVPLTPVAPTSRRTAAIDAYMVGIERTTVRIPAAATAPAPM
jgi:hypothetical protein